MESRRSKRITCSNCNAVLNVRRDLRRRAVSYHKGVTEMGLECWKCKAWIHTHFDSDDELGNLRKRYRKAGRRYVSTQSKRDRDRLQKAGEQYQVAFDEFNRRMREATGITERLIVVAPDSDVDEVEYD